MAFGVFDFMFPPLLGLIEYVNSLTREAEVVIFDTINVGVAVFRVSLLSSFQRIFGCRPSTVRGAVAEFREAGWSQPTRVSWSCWRGLLVQ